ncbi:retron St85 family effector protein [Rhodoferax sp. WC2427]|uniref:retron St85 family effector protein n=1 Tax=Rhodoferax sp. WC2427 TaxID=3234144 RepID=UPI0034672048
MSADDQDPRPVFLSNLDLSSLRIELSSTPIVLLCGGKVEIKAHVNAPPPPIKSLRHAITNAYPAFEVFRPEEIQNWSSDGIFTDLMSFEAELASVCGLVVIILESAGALVELGAFSQLPELSRKLIAIHSSEFTNQTSFVNHGILRFISDKNPSSVKSYPWSIGNESTISQEITNDLILDIQQELNEAPKSQVFKIMDNSHIMVLVCELLRYFTALKETEILEYLKILGADITKESLKRKLFLLKEFRLVKTQDYSDALFFMRTQNTFHKIRLPAKVDILRVEVQCLDYYKSNSKQRNRNRAIAQASKGAYR